ncbi:hypothetical protein M436DRAFT_67851 [Aureobasidium namibiae CBS 147.97]|uniref:Uncharacterized protein n=1 Tax=Aureobasidium namibiae CBS 147.97 TaxID=1043004 RepID=A0A074X271_9PEZI
MRNFLRRQRDTYREVPCITTQKRIAVPIFEHARETDILADSILSAGVALASGPFFDHLHRAPTDVVLSDGLARADWRVQEPWLHIKSTKPASRWSRFRARWMNRAGENLDFDMTLEGQPIMALSGSSRKVLEPYSDGARRIGSEVSELNNSEIAILRNPDDFRVPLDAVHFDTPMQIDAVPEDFPTLPSSIKREDPPSPPRIYRSITEHPTSSSDGDNSQWCLDPESLTSSGKLAEDLDGLNKRFLDLAILRPNSGLLVRSNSEPCFRESQHQTTYWQHNSSTPQDQPKNSSSKSTSNSSSSFSSSVPTTLSGGTSSGSKRQRDDPGEQSERQGAQTYRKFKACEGHFENMNRLYRQSMPMRQLSGVQESAQRQTNGGSGIAGYFIRPVQRTYRAPILKPL